LGKETAVFVGSATSPVQFPRDGLPEVAFLGRSNVGKSSLLNALAGVKDLARVSATPGRTRLVNFFRVGGLMYLADLPGYGYAKVPEGMRRSWERLVTSYLLGREPLALGVFLVDIRHDLGQGDRSLQSLLEQERLPYLVAATKADKLGRGEAGRRLASLRAELGGGALDVMAVSAQTGDGVGNLWKTIRAVATHHREESYAGN